MPNPFGAPEITVQELAEKSNAEDSFVWLDVREPHELSRASIEGKGILMVPLSELAAHQLDALPDVAQNKDAEIVVMCHHGTRSAQVVVWLQQQGWTNILNMAGGIDAWAKEIDPATGLY